MSNTKLTGSAPFFMVKDLNRALDYYCDVLGFSRPQLWEEAPHFAMPARDGFLVMLHEADIDQPIYNNLTQGGNWDAYFWTNDVDTLFSEFKGKGAVVDHEPCVQFYGIKEFAVKDSDGHILAFGQHWPQP